MQVAHYQNWWNHLCPAVQKAFCIKFFKQAPGYTPANREIGALLRRKKLSLIKQSLTDLKGFEAFANLESLNISSNQVKDLYPLQTISNLKELNIGNNQVKDLSPLANLSNLYSLDCRNNLIEGIETVKSLKRLHWLNFSNNQVSDLSPIIDKIREELTVDKSLGYIDCLYVSYEKNPVHKQPIIDFVEEVNAITTFHKRNTVIRQFALNNDFRNDIMIWVKEKGYWQ